MPKHGGWGRTGFGQRLKALREAAGLTQQELAARAGCHYMTVSELERGVNEPAWPLAILLAEALGVKLDEFRSPDDRPTSARAGRGRPKKGK